jgi:hypothetical protein
VFYFITGRCSRKADNLESKARCVIGTEHAHEAVVVEGVAARLRDLEQEAIIDALSAHRRLESALD